MDQKGKDIKRVLNVRNSKNKRQNEDTENDDDDILLRATEIMFSMITVYDVTSVRVFWRRRSGTEFIYSRHNSGDRSFVFCDGERIWHLSINCVL